jgi:hypothetical protein
LVFGVRKAGFSDPTREVGSSGIADIIWAADCRKSTFGKSNAGVLSAGMPRRFAPTAILAISGVDHVNVRRYCNGHTIRSFEVS